MSTLIAAESPPIVASVTAGALPVPFPRVLPNADFYIGFPDFGVRFAASITDFNFAKDSSKVIVQAKFNEDAVITLTLLGALIDFFHISEVWIEVRPLVQRPRAEFVASTLVALLGLSDETDLRIPIIGLDLGVGFDLSLTRTSSRLQMRQAAHRLMVIEHATGLELSVPDDYSSEDVRTITYVYHAIVDRSFAWPVGTITVSVPATQERLDMFPRDDTPTRQELGPKHVVINLLGQIIDVGEEELLVDDAVFEDLASVREELAYNDNHPVEVRIRSLHGTGTVVLKNAPRLPDRAWDTPIQALIDLEPRLDAELADRLNALAASTLADLTEEEKDEVTARAELDEEAFLDERL